MTPSSRLLELLVRWQQHREQGQLLTPEELCWDSPELVLQLKQYIEALNLSASFLDQESIPSFPSAQPAETIDYDSVASLSSEQTFRNLPGYEILGELGRGGMGVVYKARQVGLNRVVALKMILVGAHAGAAELARFRTEAEAVARLKHPNIVQIHDIGERAGLPYFSLEYCEGGSLAKKLAGTPLPPLEAAKLVETLGRAVDAAHQKNIIHRDLKPHNVLLAEHDTPKITDFGLAKKLEKTLEASVGREAGEEAITRSGAVMGTPSYMAPEQASGKTNEIGPAADVYALGAILYECLTGRPPFKATTAVDTILQVLHDEPVPPARLNRKVPRDLDTICLKCLHKDTDRRYHTATDLADDLRRFQAGEPIIARPVGRFERAWRWARRKPALASLTAATIVLALGLLMGGISYLHDQAQRRAETEKQHALNEERLRSRLERAREIRAELHQMLDSTKGLNRLLNDPALWQSRIDAAGGELKEARSLQAAGPIDPSLQARIDELAEQLQQEQQHRQTALELEQAREERSTWIEGKFHSTGALKRYRQAFASAGMDVDKLALAEIAKRLKQSAIRRQLLSALDDFAYVVWEEKDMALHERLLQTARLADPDPLRDRLRDSKLWRSSAGAEQLAGEFLASAPRMAEMPAQSMSLLAVLLSDRRVIKERWLRQAQRRHPDDFWLAFNLGYTLAQAKKFAEAAGYYGAALAVRPLNAAAWNNLGSAFHDNKDLPAAIDAYKKALAIDKQHAIAWHNLGVNLRDSKEHAAAIDAFKNALAIDKQGAQTWSELGIALAHSNDLPGAIDAFKKAIAIDKHYAAAWNNLGLALHDSKDPPAAIEAYKKALAIDKQYAMAWNNLGITLRDSKDLPAAIDALRKALAIDKQHAMAWYNLGLALYDSKDVPAAIDAYKNALAIDNQYAAAWKRLGLALRQNKDLPAAIDAYKKALAIEKQNPFAYADFGLALRDQGEFAQAVESFGRALEHLPTAHPVRSAMLREQQECRRLLALEKRVAAALKGAKTRAGEEVELAEICQRYFQRYGDSTKLYAAAFGAEPKLAENVKTGHRYDAACAAALAAAGQGKDAAGLDAKERGRLRRQALTWLEADLVGWAKRLAEQPADAAALVKHLEHARIDPDLAGIRNQKALTAFDETERKEWQKLWAGIDQLLKRARAPSNK